MACGHGHGEGSKGDEKDRAAVLQRPLQRPFVPGRERGERPIEANEQGSEYDGQDATNRPKQISKGDANGIHDETEDTADETSGSPNDSNGKPARDLATPIRGALTRSSHLPAHPGGHDRKQRQGHEQGGEERECDGQAEIRKESPRHTRHVQHRAEHGDGGECRRRDGAGDFVRPYRGGSGSVKPLLLPVSEDVLQHHDGVVHQHSDPEGQSAQGHHVEAHIGQVAQRERSHDGNRDREPDGHRVTRVPEEQKQHQKGQNATEQKRLHHVRDRIRDERSLARGHLDPDLWKLLPQLCENIAHLVRHPDGIGPGLLVDEKSDRRLAVEASHRFPVRLALEDPGHVAEANDPSPRGTRHHHVLQLLDALEFTQRPEAVPKATAANASPWRTVVGPVEGIGDLGDRDIVHRQPTRIDLDLDLADGSAGDRRHGDPVQLLEATLEHGIGQVPQLGQVRAGDRERYNRIVGWIRRENHGALGALREASDQVIQALPDVEHRELHVRAPVKLQAHQGLPFARSRIDGANSRNAADHGFHGLGDEPLDLRRTGVRVRRPDRERGKRHVGQEVDRQPGERHDAQDPHGQVQHGRRDGALDRQVGQCHQLAPWPRSPPTFSSRLAHPIR